MIDNQFSQTEDKEGLNTSDSKSTIHYLLKKMQVAKYDNNPDKLLGTMYYYVQVLDTHSLTYLTYLVTVYLPTHLLTTSHYLPTHIQQSEQRRGWMLESSAK